MWRGFQSWLQSPVLTCICPVWWGLQACRGCVSWEKPCCWWESGAVTHFHWMFSSYTDTVGGGVRGGGSTQVPQVSSLNIGSHAPSVRWQAESVILFSSCVSKKHRARCFEWPQTWRRWPGSCWPVRTDGGRCQRAVDDLLDERSRHGSWVQAPRLPAGWSLVGQ